MPGFISGIHILATPTDKDVDGEFNSALAGLNQIN